jgi:hypothetical protein
MDAVIEEKDDDLEQLMLLRDLTNRTGVLIEAQCLQLKYYPLIMTHAIESSFEFDFDKSKIIFNLTKTKGKEPRNIKKRLDVLAKCTKMLLGDEYTVVVKLKDTEIYRSLGELNVKKSRKNKTE